MSALFGPQDVRYGVRGLYLLDALWPCWKDPAVFLSVDLRSEMCQSEGEDQCEVGVGSWRRDCRVRRRKGQW